MSPSAATETLKLIMVGVYDAVFDPVAVRLIEPALADDPPVFIAYQRSVPRLSPFEIELSVGSFCRMKYGPLPSVFVFAREI